VNPIRFSCEETLGLLPEDIARQILDLTNWTDFKGYRVLPGIRSAEFEVRTPGVVGSRIRVTNTDGSSHVEEIVEWQPDRRLRLHMQNFSAPLSRLATRFVETWDFQRIDNGTRVIRSFELHAQSTFRRPVVWLISILLKRAISRHLMQMRDTNSARQASTCK
jgi:Polyketide cyclase / dehydrase and lipid transport